MYLHLKFQKIIWGGVGIQAGYNWEIAKREFILTCNFYNFYKESIFVYYLFY